MRANRPSQTAEAVCLFRASDQRRAPGERILDDPYAKLFLGPVARAALLSWRASGPVGQLAERSTPGLVTWVLCRHRYIDDQLSKALEGDVEQVVLLGAGYDTRAYRFSRELRDRPVFEVDFPATSRRKAEIVGAHRDQFPEPNVHRVEVDFERDSLRGELLTAGFQAHVRTFFVWEGVTMYLTRKAVKETLTALHEMSAAGSDVVADFWHLVDSPDLISTARRVSANLLALFGEPVTFGIHPEDVGPFFDRLGWELADLGDAATLESRYVRDGRHIDPACYAAHAISQ